MREGSPGFEKKARSPRWPGRTTGRPRIDHIIDRSLNLLPGLRERLGLSMGEFALAAGLSLVSYGHYETGQSLPSPLTAKKIQAMLAANGIEVSLDDLYRHVRVHNFLIVQPRWPKLTVPL